LAERIAKVQGNIFIKELLRSKKKNDSSIKIGLTKEEILGNLLSAIRAGKITGSDIEAWINEVEGWGKQHVYMYDLTKKLSDSPIWSSPETILTCLKRLHLDKSWQKTEAISFPDQLELAHIDFSNGKFECVWRRGVVARQRDKSKDRLNEVIEGDTYDFHAHRHLPVRSVMRFEMLPAERQAALFLQIPLGPEHADAIQEAFQLLGKVFDASGLTPTDISRAIKKLDKAELEAAGAEQSSIQAQATKFSTSGATVEFSADPTIQAWKSVTAVRQVRRALRDDQFEGDSGKFTASLRAKDGMKRDVTISLSGQQKRLYLHAQMTAEEVMVTLDTVRKHSTK